MMAALGALVASGCARHKADVQTAGSAPPGAFAQDVTGAKPDQKLIVTPETTPVGKVVRINPAARFVVLSFPVGRLPTMDQRMSVYHQGLKAGEVKVTGPQMDDNVVADLLAGDAQVGDEVRGE